MRILLFIPLLCSLAFSQIGGKAGIGGKSGIGQGVPPSGAGCNGTTPTGCVFRETFEGASACWAGSAFTNCDATQWLNTFAGANTVYNYATAPAPLQGSFSLSIINTSQAIADFTAASTNYVGTIVNMPGFVDFADHIQVRDASNNELCGVQFSSGGTQFVVTNTGGSTVGSASGLTTGTWYIQVKATAGSGANAVCNLLYSSTGASGSWTTVSSTNGTWTNQPSRLLFAGDAGGTLHWIFDDVRVYTAQMNWN